mgnify:CR=1 FL=1
MIPIKDFNQMLDDQLNEIKQRLTTKHEAYGDAEDFITVFSKSTAIDRLQISIDDKLSRIANHQADDAEDAETDLLGYLVLLKIARLNAAKSV